MQRKIFVIIFIILSLDIIYSVEFFKTNNISTRFVITSGLGYNLKISTNYYYQQDILPLSIPLKFGFDTRFVDWFSLYAGIDFVYQIRTYNNTIDSNPITFYNNNLFIDLPLIFKFYPLSSKFDIYENFFIGIGIFPHFWVVNSTYFVYNETQYTENAYTTGNGLLPPKNIYTPVNVGLYLSVGNHFSISQNVLFGIELFSDYLFVPVINGNYVNPPVLNANDTAQMDFYVKFGFAVSFAFELSRI